jgi:hypothetical protein
LCERICSAEIVSGGAYNMHGNTCFHIPTSSGDGRMDSPGFCAKYCTYTVLEYDTKEILDCVVVDKLQTDLKSTNMEIFAFKKVMATFQQFGIVIKEVVTDAHMGIAAFMSMYIFLYSCLLYM